MKYNNKNLLFITILTFFICLPNVFAETSIKARGPIKINDQTVYKMYDDLITGEDNYVGTAGYWIELTIDGTVYTSYCIDLNMHLVSGDNAKTYDLYEYYRNVIGDSEAKELVRKMTLYARYGYGYNGKNNTTYYLATQKLIWEAINATGFYQSDYYKERAGINLNISNFGWSTDKKTRIDLTNEINAIQSDVSKHNITPSFCNDNNKLEIELGETVTYTDKNGVLASYKTVCDSDLECVQEGNTLKITAKNNAGNKKIRFVKETNGTESILYRAGTQQSIIPNTGKLENVSCEFGINSFKNVQTSDSKIVYISILGLFCAFIAFFTYKTKHI